MAASEEPTQTKSRGRSATSRRAAKAAPVFRATVVLPGGRAMSFDCHADPADDAPPSPELAAFLYEGQFRMTCLMNGVDPDSVAPAGADFPAQNRRAA